MKIRNALTAVRWSQIICVLWSDDFLLWQNVASYVCSCPEATCMHWLACDTNMYVPTPWPLEKVDVCLRSGQSAKLFLNIGVSAPSTTRLTGVQSGYPFCDKKSCKKKKKTVDVSRGHKYFASTCQWAAWSAPSKRQWQAERLLGQLPAIPAISWKHRMHLAKLHKIWHSWMHKLSCTPRGWTRLPDQKSCSNYTMCRIENVHINSAFKHDSHWWLGLKSEQCKKC